MAEESAATEQETAPESPEERTGPGSGPGFILGVVLGLLAGAAGATLFAPAAGEKLRQRITEEAAPLLKHEEGESGEEGARAPTVPDRLRARLSRVRSRVKEASNEAREAAREAEERSHARYSELTEREEPHP